LIFNNFNIMMGHLKSWKCNKCYISNDISERECRGRSCSEWRPRHLIPKRKGDWECCGETQFASRNKCRKCEKDKSDQTRVQKLKEQYMANGWPNNNRIVTFRPGDWMCVKCNDHQFADRTQCRKCGSSRPVKEDADGNDIGNPCVICFAKERNVAFIHDDTGHFVCCKECASKCDTCPMCRQKIDKTINIY